VSTGSGASHPAKSVRDNTTWMMKSGARRKLGDYRADLTENPMFYIDPQPRRYQTLSKNIVNYNYCSKLLVYTFGGKYATVGKRKIRS
jgi:hypothetical protein